RSCRFFPRTFYASSMPGRDRIKVLMVDDHPLFRQGLRQVILSDSRFELAGEAESGESALDIVQERKPDIVVLDVNLPKMSGLELAAILRQKKFPGGLVVLTMLKDEQVFNQAMNVGIAGFVLKENAAGE